MASLQVIEKMVQLPRLERGTPRSTITSCPNEINRPLDMSGSSPSRAGVCAAPPWLELPPAA
jgi:hypothetical protein